MEVLVMKVYMCNCGEPFIDRDSLVKHIKNKKKGKYRNEHFAGDYVSGNHTGLVRWVRKVI